MLSDDRMTPALYNTLTATGWEVSLSRRLTSHLIEAPLLIAAHHALPDQQAVSASELVRRCWKAEDAHKEATIAVG